MIEVYENYVKVLCEMEIGEDSVKSARDILRDNEPLRCALRNPNVSPKEKHRIIDRVFRDDIRSFLKILVKFGRLDDMDKIYSCYHRLSVKKRNIIEAEFRSAALPDENQLEAVKKMLCKKYHMENAVVHVEEDPSLIGGCILTVENTVYDKSTRTLLRDLKNNLAKR